MYFPSTPALKTCDTVVFKAAWGVTLTSRGLNEKKCGGFWRWETFAKHRNCSSVKWPPTTYSPFCHMCFQQLLTINHTAVKLRCLNPDSIFHYSSLEMWFYQFQFKLLLSDWPIHKVKHRNVICQVLVIWFGEAVGAFTEAMPIRSCCWQESKARFSWYREPHLFCSVEFSFDFTFQYLLCNLGTNTKH